MNTASGTVFKRPLTIYLIAIVYRSMTGGLRLPEHSHCIYCEDPIPFGEEYCNDECRRNEELRQKAEKRKEYRFWGSAGVVIVIVIALGVILRL